MLTTSISRPFSALDNSKTQAFTKSARLSMNVEDASNNVEDQPGSAAATSEVDSVVGTTFASSGQSNHVAPLQLQVIHTQAVQVQGNGGHVSQPVEHHVGRGPISP